MQSFFKLLGWKGFQDKTKQCQEFASDWFSFLNLGKRSNDYGLFCPPDLSQSHERFGANCGPASFAAAGRVSIATVMELFPHFPKRAWTTIGDMRAACLESSIGYREINGSAPKYGVALIQLVTKNTHPIAALKRTHWVAICGDCIYDVNWDGWLPIAIWEELVFRTLQRHDPNVVSWRIKTGLEFSESLQEDLPQLKSRHESTLAS